MVAQKLWDAFRVSVRPSSSSQQSRNKKKKAKLEKEKQKPTTKECSICWESKISFPTLSCGCQNSCTSCLRSLMRANSSQNLGGALEAKCPTCRKTMKDEDWSLALSSSHPLFIKYMELKELQTLPKSNFFGCPEDGCFSGGYANCFGKVVCRICKRSWQVETAGILNWRKTIHFFVWLLHFLQDFFIISQDEKTQFVKKFRTQTCPNTNCGAPIEKNGGCPHMTCIICNHQFCWHCFFPWRSHPSLICPLAFVWNLGRNFILGCLLVAWYCPSISLFFSAIFWWSFSWAKFAIWNSPYLITGLTWVKQIQRLSLRSYAPLSALVFVSFFFSFFWFSSTWIRDTATYFPLFNIGLVSGLKKDGWGCFYCSILFIAIMEFAVLPFLGSLLMAWILLPVFGLFTNVAAFVLEWSFSWNPALFLGVLVAAEISAKLKERFSSAQNHQEYCGNPGSVLETFLWVNLFWNAQNSIQFFLDVCWVGVGLLWAQPGWWLMLFPLSFYVLKKLVLL